MNEGSNARLQEVPVHDGSQPSGSSVSGKKWKVGGSIGKRGDLVEQFRRPRLLAKSATLKTPVSRSPRLQGGGSTSPLAARGAAAPAVPAYPGRRRHRCPARDRLQRPSRPRNLGEATPVPGPRGAEPLGSGTGGRGDSTRRSEGGLSGTIRVMQRQCATSAYGS